MGKSGIAACACLSIGYLACANDTPSSDGASSSAGGANVPVAGAAGITATGAGASGAPVVSAGVGGVADLAGAPGAGAAGAAPAGTGGASGGAGQEAMAGAAPVASPLPAKSEVLATLQKVNSAWITGHANPGDNLWARSVYFIGDTEFAKISGRPEEAAYATKWAAAHAYGLNGGTKTVSADDQCAGQSYLALNALAGDPMKVAAIKASLSAMVKNNTSDSWWWIDALFMAMPSFVALGVSNDDPSYFSSMWALYNHTKRSEGGSGLYNASDALWWRDKSYMPPHLEPNGKNTYWSRGNGWVFAAHARVLATLPDSETHRAEYLSTFQAMAVALKKVQRTDGFWNVSLADPTHFPGPETSGTSLFVYGFALGIAHGWLDRATYEPVVDKGYRALVMTSVHADGTLGYIQGVGADPSSSQPVTATSNQDFGVGAFLLGGSAVYALTPN